MKNSNLSLITNLGFACAVIVILSTTFWLRTQYLLWSDWGYDQGFYLLVAHLMAKGFAPYQQIHMSEPPLMVWSVDLPLQWFGSLWGMRFAMVGFTLVGMAALIRMGQLLDGRLTGLIAGGLLVFDTYFFGTGVDPGLPSVSLALVSIVMALEYRASKNLTWLLLSGVLLAGSFLLKLYMVVAIPVIGLIIYLTHLDRYQSWSQLKAPFLKDTLIWAGTVSLCMLMVYTIYGLPTLLTQTVLFHLYKSAAYVYDIKFNAAVLWKFIADRGFIWIIALYALGRGVTQPKKFGWIMFGWLFFSLIFLLLFNPLRVKHLILLVPFGALLAGLALSHLITFAQNPNHSVNWLVRSVGIVLFISLLTYQAVTFIQLNKRVKPVVSEGKQPIVEMLRQFTAPTDCIITDDPYIAIDSDRMPPPWLSNLSYARFESNSLAEQDLFEITNNHNCQVVVPTFDRLKNSNRTYYDWTKGEYLRTWVVDGKEIMLAKPLTQVTPTIPLYAEFQNQVTLLGIDWIKSEKFVDNQRYISLYWQTLQPFDRNYKIFVQLRNTQGQTVASADHEAFNGLVPTKVWPVDSIIKETNTIIIPDDIAPGQYSLYVGLYDPTTLERLPIVNDTSGENAAVIANVIEIGD